MLKRVLAFALSILLIVAILPVTTSAATQEEEINQQIVKVYRKVQNLLGRWDLHGLCGLMTDYQLYVLGVDTTLNISDGNGQYDEYCNLDMTADGYPVTVYPAANYTLEEALYTMSNGGTRDVYNVLVGFQWTNTTAGARYGHACVIHAILDGYVYFVEGFYTPMGGAAGNPAKCTIEEFADYYGSWTRFEGAVEFGRKEYMDFCQEYAANLFVRTTKEAQLLLNLGEDQNSEANVVRTVATGECLEAKRLYKDTLGQYYYQVVDSGTTCYLPAEHTSLVQFNYEDISVDGIVAPEALKQNKDFAMAGKVTSTDSMFSSLEVVITNAQGAVVQKGILANRTHMHSLKNAALNKALDFSKLPAGAYTYTVNAVVENNYLAAGQLITSNSTIMVHQNVFSVGAVDTGSSNLPGSGNQGVKNGLIWENGAWYYYEAGKLRTGWFCENGINYYFGADGAAVTGWAKINEQLRFFSDTGAMRTGWLEAAGDRYYLLRNGVPAVGWKEIDGKKYYFDSDGSMCYATWITESGARYYLQEDGTMAIGWVQLPEGDKYFLEDGRLYAEVSLVGNQKYVNILDKVIPGMDSVLQSKLPNMDAVS